MLMRSDHLTPRSIACSDAPQGVVAIVASAGGIPALIALLERLPSSFALPIVIAQHLPRGPSMLPTILGWRSRLNICWAADAQQPEPGHVYVAPPGTRLTLMPSGFALAPLGPASATWLACGDHLIRSAAAVHGARAVAIVLSGAMPAGVEGLRAINACGGITMAQDKASSSCFDMPCAAIDFGKASIVTTPQRMAEALQVIAEDWSAVSVAA
jgi:chemotaxis response regulator CheB